MAKVKKRRKIDQVSHLSNLTGFGGETGGDFSSSSVDDCLAEMQQQVEQGQQSHANSRQKQKPTVESSHRPSWIRQKSCMSGQDIDVWNRSFVAWSNRHHAISNPYPPGLLPNIDEELARNFKVKELSSFLLQRFPWRDLRMPVFERWLLDSKFEEEHNSPSTSSSGRSTNTGASSNLRDPILPLYASPDSEASQRLLAELLATKGVSSSRDVQCVSRKDAEAAIAELCRKANLSCQELLSQRDRYKRQSPLRKGDRILIEASPALDETSRNNSGTDVVTILYCRKKWKKPFCFKINSRHYQNLKSRFLEIHGSASSASYSGGGTSIWSSSLSLAGTGNSDTSNVDRFFNIIVLALLLRYSALSGGQLLEDLRGGGMQGSIHSAVFECLQSHLGNGCSGDNCWLEGFASPFNATLPRFASAFPDLDWHFGAVGSFFECTFEGDCIESGNGEYCEANPPFSPGIMQAMADHIFETLRNAEESDRKLTFVVVVPSATKSKEGTIPLSPNTEGEAVVKQKALRSFQDMMSSAYCTKHIQLKARDHGYVEGSQHLRPTMYKQSAYDTSVIILQSPKAAKASSRIGMDKLESDIRSAFSSRHEDEQKKRKAKSF